MVRSVFCFNLNLEPQCDLASDTSLISALWKANPGAKGSCFMGSPVILMVCISGCLWFSKPQWHMKPSFALDHEAGYSGCTNIVFLPAIWISLFQYKGKNETPGVTADTSRQCGLSQFGGWSYPFGISKVWYFSLHRPTCTTWNITEDTHCFCVPCRRTLMQAFALWSYLQSILLVLPLLGLCNALSVH